MLARDAGFSADLVRLVQEFGPSSPTARIPTKGLNRPDFLDPSPRRGLRGEVSP